ncbi:MAG: methanogenesis marker 12 protein [Methanosphaera sp.]|nr:methanogenesis marker 12 protein [Methanosphaera sp.]
MKYYMGMDHGTTAISFNIIDENKENVAYFKLNRDKLSNNEVSFKDTLNKYINPKQINLLAITYAMGDNINSITPMNKVKNKGIKSLKGAGKVTGGGSKVYDEIIELNIPSVLIPGLHKNSTFLDDRFTASYSHCASSEKVSLSYYAYCKTSWKNMIIADISSNTVSILIENGKIRGAIDACLGAMGFIHGPLDLDMIRDIDEGKRSANECFSHAGISKIAKVDSNINNIKNKIIENAVNEDKNAVLAIESLIMSVIMEIYGLYGISEEELDGIVLTGSGGTMTEPINISAKIREKIESIAPVKVLTDRSGAIGSSYIAYDICENKKEEIIGIKVMKD